MIRKTVKGAVLKAINAYDKRHGGPEALPYSEWGMTVSPEGELCWDGCSLVALAREHGTPLYVVSRSRLEKNYRGFLGAFASRYPKVEVGYSYKTNPLPGVIKALHEFGASAEVISHFELWLALQLGVAPDNIMLNGPGKSDAALELAVERGIRLINVDNLDEIAKIDRLAAHFGRKQQIGVRVVTSVGWSAQFGLSIETGAAREAFQRMKAAQHLVPCSLHAHLGTGIRDAQVYFRAVGEILAFARQMRDEFGIDMRYLDLGGGFGVPTVRPLTQQDVRLLENGYSVVPPREGQAPSIEEYAEGIVAQMARYYDLASGDVPLLFFEPGRAITSSAQCLLVSVLAIKQGNRFGNFVISNGGKNITMPLGYEYHESFVANRMNSPRDTRYSVFGPLCHPGDILFKHRHLPKVVPGDLITVMDAGAYFVPNQMNFSNPRPAAVMVFNGRSELIRRRESFEDIVRLDDLDGRRALT